MPSWGLAFPKDHYQRLKQETLGTPSPSSAPKRNHYTSDIFGRPVYNYSYREAVLDNYLVDHEPPYLIKTELSEEGIHWNEGETVQIYDPDTGKISTHQTPGELDFDVSEFNKKVIAPGFNKTVCEYLAQQIDPALEEKTLIFCANDRHADLVVDLFKKAFQKQYGEVADDAVLKIMGKSDKPLQLIRRYRNEKLPNVAVTVDLLTTGIDVWEICNLVFIRRVNSRILYEQMIGKEVFRIYDAVDIYENMKDYTDMTPVVVDPKITFQQLEKEIREIDSESMKQLAKEQFIAKLQRKKNVMNESPLRRFEINTGFSPDEFIQHIANLPIGEVADWFMDHPNLGENLDEKSRSLDHTIPISDENDRVRRFSGAGAKSDRISRKIILRDSVLLLRKTPIPSLR